ncbi:MAG: S-layer homology domain-containing protein [Lawsonibacter sp.]|nr:S-layer homology domain-containing protein [Lawsonibacter sp.]
MRNLKRALSLAMASVMLLGLMVVGTGASYSDVASKHNTEAIEVLQAVGIMTGDEKGNFNPDKNVTRNEMAVVMANMLELNVKDFTGSGNPFTDVPAWAQPYVTACYADGIVAGTSKTTYGGDATVTAVQAGLMVMKALGYFQYQEDFGDDWQLATVKQASTIDLYDGIDAGRTEALTRNEVAQLVLNALEADVVDFTGTVGTDIKTSDGTTIKVGYKSEYTALTTSYDYNTSGKNVRQLCEQLYDNDLRKTEPDDVFGRPANQWKYKTEVIGTYAEKADATYANKVTKGTLYDLVGKDVVNKLTASGTGTPVEYKLTVVVDGLTLGDNGTSAPVKTDYFTSKSTAAAGTGATGTTGNGMSTEVYIDDDSNVTIVIINTYVAQAASDYSTKNENLKIEIPANATQPGTLTSLTLDEDDFAVSSYEEEDYILYTAAWDGTSKYEIQAIAPATVVTGTVDSYADADSVTIDGAKYSYVKTISADTTNGKGVEYSTGDDATVVLDANGYVIYVDEAVTDSGNWVYVDEVASANGLGNNFVADAYFADGTNQTVTVKNWTTTGGTTYSTGLTTGTATTGIAAGWYTYSIDSSSKYKLTAKADAKIGSTVTSGDVITNGSTTLAGGTGVKANASTIFVVVDADDDITVYTGIANAPTVTATGSTTLYVVKNSSNSYAKFVFVDAANATIVDGASSSSEYVYLLKKDSTNTNSNGDKYITYKALVDGEATTVNLADTCSQNALFTLYYKAKTNSDGYVTSMSLASAKSTVATVAEIGVGKPNTEAVVKYSDGVLTFDGNNSDVDLVLASNYTIYLVSAAKNINTDDGASYEVSTPSASSLKSTLNGYKITGNYYVEKVDSESNSAVSAIYLYVATAVAGSAPADSNVTTVASASAAKGTDPGNDLVVTPAAVVNNTTHTIVVSVAATGADDGDTIVVTATATDSNATVSGTATLTRTTGTWDTGTITITAEDGTTTQAYTVSVTEA